MISNDSLNSKKWYPWYKKTFSMDRFEVSEKFRILYKNLVDHGGWYNLFIVEIKYLSTSIDDIVKLSKISKNYQIETDFIITLSPFHQKIISQCIQMIKLEVSKW